MAKFENVLIKSILHYKIVITLLTGTIVFIFLIIFSTVIDIVNPELSFEPLSQLFSLLTTLLAIIIALIIPFIMKDIERRKKEKIEIESMKMILERIREYLSLPVRPDEESKFPSFELPYFKSLVLNQPHLLMKLGIEVHMGSQSESGLDFPSLYILDKYRLFLSRRGLHLQKVNQYGQYQDVSNVEGISDKIIQEIKENTRKKFIINIE